MADREIKAPWQSEFFVGVPAPMGAMLVLLPVYLGFLGLGSSPLFVYGSVAYTILIGYLLVSRLPVWSGKSSRIRRDLMLPILLAVVLYVALLMSYTWEVLSITVIAYLCVLPFSARAWHRRYGTITIEDDSANV
jgi:CDP-diacylglycerol---serine O-phosphatidyltransferase